MAKAKTNYTLIRPKVDQAEIERLMDKHDTAPILDAIVRVLHEKATHIEEAWQDAEMAEQWHEAARALDNVIGEVERLLG